MKNTMTNRIKNRIIGAVLSAITVFSVGTATVTTASAAQVSVASVSASASLSVSDTTAKTAGEIVKSIACFVAEKAGGAIVSTLVNKGVSYILGLAFDDQDKDQGPGIQDVLNELTNISGKIDTYHKEEMNYLKLINSNIDSKDFRVEADSIADDYQGAFRTMYQYGKNITSPGDGEINQTTYRTYKAILADSSCNLSALQKNFNIMAAYVKGSRSATDYRSGYRLSSEYLMNKVLANYKETDHDWTKSTDFKEVVENVNGELDTMQANAVMDFLAIIALNNMSYKVRQYEVNHGIYIPDEDEDPYAYYEKVAESMVNALVSLNEIHAEVQKENLANHDFVQAIVELSEPVDGKKIKGFHSFTEAWVQASATGKDFTVTGYQDVASSAKNGYNLDDLSNNQYGFTVAPYGHLVKSGRTVTVDLNGHTFDSSATSGTIGAFGLEGNVNFTLKNANVKNGHKAIYVYNWDNVSVSLENVSIDGTADSAILFKNPNSKKIHLNLRNTSIKNTKNGSAIRIASADAIYNIDGCTFENNKGGDGGALSCPACNDENTVKNCTFINNNATAGYGGALNIKKASVTDSIFKGNRSAFWGRDSNGNGCKGAGGAITAEHLVCDNCIFDGNTTNDQAGAIFITFLNGNWNITAITNCKFTNNYSPNVGGAVRVFAMGKYDTQHFKNCSFSGNTSTRGHDIFTQWNYNDCCSKIRNAWGNTSDRPYGVYAYLND